MAFIVLKFAYEGTIHVVRVNESGEGFWWGIPYRGNLSFLRTLRPWVSPFPTVYTEWVSADVVEEECKVKVCLPDRLNGMLRFIVKEIEGRLNDTRDEFGEVEVVDLNYGHGNDPVFRNLMVFVQELIPLLEASAGSMGVDLS